jgi:hypothetical protein
VIRTMSTAGNRGTVDQILRAKEIYYDVTNSRAVAVCADLELRGAGFADPVHVRGKEIWQLGRNEWRAFEAETSASKRPSDPNLTVGATETRLIQRETVLTNIFGVPYRDFRNGGEKMYGTERTLTNWNNTLRVRDVPVFYWPKTVNDLAEPFGPFLGVGFGNDNIFGQQFYTTWDVYKLLAIRPPQNHTWRLDADYLSDRGPAGGTVYTYSGLDFFGRGGPHHGLFKAYGINDRALFDQLGGDRGPQPPKPEFRGRVQWRHNQDLYEDGTTYVHLISQYAWMTDKNFLEQYYKQEFDMGANQETFGYLSGATGNLYGSLWTEYRNHRPWMTETEWLPRLDGAIIGETFLSDRLVYSGRANMAYANQRPAEQPPFPVMPTDQLAVGLGRFDLNQRVSAPFDLGFVRFNPYGVVDLAYYTSSLEQTPITGNPPFGPGLGQVYGQPWVDYSTRTVGGLGRFYGGGGLEASSTASRVYQDVQSELFNLNGLNHKVTLSGNYFAAYSDQPYTRFPQLDRMFDDSLDQGYRNIRPFQPTLIPGPAGVALSKSPLYDPQQYAIRRLVDNKPDTLASIQEVQLALRQRLQTKRGFPGMEHTVDWMTLDLSASAFPDAQRDNYGETWSFLEYLYLWNLGDRFSLSSAGWYDPFEYGARYWNVGINFNRPDGTNFFLTYRHTDPLKSRAVTAATSYQLSAKYAMNLSTTYDFGTNEALTNTLSLTRTGPDVTMLVGFTYNALINNFGFQFALLPNVASLAPGQRVMSSGLSTR